LNFRLDGGDVDASSEEFASLAVNGDDGEVLVKSGVNEFVKNLKKKEFELG
jgi:hypothetical protein